MNFNSILSLAINRNNDEVSLLDTGQGIGVYDLASRAELEESRWLKREVPSDTVAFSIFGDWTYFLVTDTSSSLKKIVRYATRTKVKDAFFNDIFLGLADNTATDLHATADGFYIAFNDSQEIKYYAARLTQTVLTAGVPATTWASNHSRVGDEIEAPTDLTRIGKSITTSVDPTDNQAYVVIRHLFNNSPRFVLQKLNHSSGVFTDPVIAFTRGGSYTGTDFNMDFAPDGTLYVVLSRYLGINYGSRSLFKLNKRTGELALVAHLPASTQTIESNVKGFAVISNTEGRLIFGQDNSRLYKIDLTDAATTVLQAFVVADITNWVDFKYYNGKFYGLHETGKIVEVNNNRLKTILSLSSALYQSIFFRNRDIYMTQSSSQSGSSTHYDKIKLWRLQATNGSDSITRGIREVKVAFNNTDKYRYIGGYAGTMVGMKADGSLRRFAINGDKTLASTTPLPAYSAWKPAGVSDTYGVTRNVTHAYVGTRNSGSIRAVNLTTGAYDAAKSISSTTIDIGPSAATLDISNRSVREGVARTIKLDQADGGVGNFTYAITSTSVSGITLSNVNNFAELTVADTTSPGTYRITVQATKTSDSSVQASSTFLLEVLAILTSNSANSITSLATNSAGNNVLALDNDTGLHSFLTASGTANAGARWLSTEVPDNAIAMSSLGEFTYFLITDATDTSRAVRVEKWTTFTKTRVTDEDISLDFADRDANDIHATSNWLFITKRDSTTIRAYKQSLTSTTQTGNVGRKIGIADFVNNTPHYISKFLDGYLVGVVVSNFMNYFYVKKDGTSIKSLHREKFDNTTVQQSYTATVPGPPRVTTVTVGHRNVYVRRGTEISSSPFETSSNYPTASQALTAADSLASTYSSDRYEFTTSTKAGPRKRGSQISGSPFDTSGDYATASAAQTAARSLQSSKTGTSYERVASSKQKRVPGTDTPVSGIAANGPWRNTAAAARADYNAIIILYSSVTYDRSAYSEGTQTAKGAEIPRALINTSNNDYKTNALASTWQDSAIAYWIRNRYPWSSYSGTTQSDFEYVKGPITQPAGVTVAGDPVSTTTTDTKYYNGVWRSSRTAATNDHSTTEDTVDANFSCSGTRSYDRRIGTQGGPATTRFTARRTTNRSSSRNSVVTEANQIKSDWEDGDYPSPRYSITIVITPLFANTQFVGVVTVYENIAGTTQYRSEVRGKCTTSSIPQVQAHRGQVKVYRKAYKPDITQYRYEGLSIRRKGTPTTRYVGVLTIYNRVASYIGVKRVYNRVFRREPITEQRSTPTTRQETRYYNDITKNIVKFYQQPNSNKLFKMTNQYRASSVAGRGTFNFTVKGDRGTGLVTSNAVNTGLFNALTASTSVFSKALLSVAGGKLGDDFFTEFAGANYQSNFIPSSEADIGLLFLPNIVATASAITSAGFRLYNVDLSANSMTEITSFRNLYTSVPTSSNLSELRDTTWEGNDTDVWKNIRIRRGSNVVNFTNNSPVTQNVTALAQYPDAAGSIPVTGSGFAFNSTTDWAAGVAGGIWSVASRTAVVRSREKKTGYTHATNKYRWIGGSGSDVVAMTTDGTLQTFSLDADGNLTTVKTISATWVPGLRQAISLYGVTKTSDTIYVGARNPALIYAIRQSDGTLDTDKEISTTAVSPTSIAEPTLNISDKTASKRNLGNLIALEEADDGVGAFVYRLTSPTALITLSIQGGAPFLLPNNLLPIGNYSLSLEATRLVDGRAQEAQKVKTDFTLSVQDISSFVNNQGNFKISFAAGEDQVNVRLEEFSTDGISISDLVGRYLGSRLDYISSTTQAADSTDWSYEGNVVSDPNWYSKTRLQLKSSIPKGIHTFRITVLENISTESYADINRFSPITSNDARKEFTVEVLDPGGDVELLQPDVFYTKGEPEASFILNPATGGRNGVFTYSIGTLPAGVTFSAASRLLRIANTTAVGEHTISYTAQPRTAANDANDGPSKTVTFKVTVKEYEAPVNNQGTIRSTAGTSKTIRLLDSTGGTGRYNYTITGLTDHLIYLAEEHSIRADSDLVTGTYKLTLTTQPIDNLNREVGASSKVEFNLIVAPPPQVRFFRYGYAVVYKWIDGNGLEHFSGTHRQNISLRNPIGTTFDNAVVTVDLYTDKIYNTLKVPVFVEIYRTEANLVTLKKLDAIQLTGNEDRDILYRDASPDSVLGGRELLYSSVAVGDNIQPESATTMQIFANHVAIAGMTGDRRRVLLSKRFDPALHRPVEFDGLTAFVLPEDIVSLKRLDNLCVCFTTKRIFAFNVLDFQSSDPTEIQTSFGISPDSKNAIVRTTTGLVMKSNKGFYLLTRELTLSYVGKSVEQYNSYKCLKAVISNARRELYFLLQKEGERTVILTLNLDFTRWSELDAEDVTDIAIHRNSLVLLKNGKIYATKDGLFIPSRSRPLTIDRFLLETQWINVGRLDGFSRIRRCMLVGNLRCARTVTIDVAYDFEDFDPRDTVELELDQVQEGERFLIKLRRQKCSSVRFKIRAVTNGPCNVSGIGIEYGVDPYSNLIKQGSVGATE